MTLSGGEKHGPGADRFRVAPAWSLGVLVGGLDRHTAGRRAGGRRTELQVRVCSSQVLLLLVESHRRQHGRRVHAERWMQLGVGKGAAATNPSSTSHQPRPGSGIAGGGSKRVPSMPPRPVSVTDDGVHGLVRTRRLADGRSLAQHGHDGVIRLHRARRAARLRTDVTQMRN